MAITSTSMGRLALVVLCAPALYGGFMAISRPELAQEVFQAMGRHGQRGANALAFADAIAAMAVILFEGVLRRVGAWWLAGVTALAAATVYPFWAQWPALDLGELRHFLGLLAFAAAFVVVAVTSFRQPAPLPQ